MNRKECRDFHHLLQGRQNFDCSVEFSNHSNRQVKYGLLTVAFINETISPYRNRAYGGDCGATLTNRYITYYTYYKNVAPL
ncbi:hypothetical protein HanIR_Chr02g0091541 [Helianthus annuus]|nr:hypothetical protein HanIR_Chr02g0091541 [Helianthus annuus]